MEGLLEGESNRSVGYSSVCQGHDGWGYVDCGEGHEICPGACRGNSAIRIQGLQPSLSGSHKEQLQLENRLLTPQQTLSSAERLIC